MVLPTALLYTVFIVLTHVPSITVSLRLLSWKDIRLCCTHTHTPFASVEMMMWFLSLSSFTWWITFIDLHVWTILISLEWSQLGYGGWSFGCALEFSLLIVYWELWHLCSSRRLLCRCFLLYFSWLGHWDDGSIPSSSILWTNLMIISFGSSLKVR